MNIGVDINEANIPQRVGINQVAYATFTHLIEHLKKDDHVYALSKDGPLPDMPLENEQLTYEVFGPKKLWVLTGLTRRLLFGKPKIDVLFSPTHYTPLVSRTPTVVFLMDLAFERFGSEYFTTVDLTQLKRWTPMSVKKAKHVLTISEFSKSEIVKFYNTDPNKISVVYPSFNRDLYHGKVPKTKQSQVKKKYGITGSYLLYIGTLQPRKNLSRLVEAFAELNRPRLKLVLGGKKGWFYQQIFDKVKDLGLEDRVIFTGFVPDEDLPALIKSSRAYVLPSLYEGFGMPAVEAQAVGTPVVASHISSLPEIVGSSGIYIDNPKSIDDIVQALEKVLSLTPTQRQQIIEDGKENTKRFDWNRSSQKILDILQQTGSKA